MDAESRRVSILAIGALGGYSILIYANPVRPSLRDGLRCLLRYKQIWAVPVAFTLCYSAFTVWMHWYECRHIPDGSPVIAPWAGWQPPLWRGIIALCWLPSAEGAAAIFNYIVRPFPLSVVGALGFLANWRGYQGVVFGGLRRRFGRTAGLVIHLALVVGALAAAIKPLLFVGLTNPDAFVGETTLLRWGEFINALGFLFEYLLGIGVQIYLILLCLVWIRGITFDFHRVRRLALRRFVFVVRGAVPFMLVSTLGITLPLIVSRFGTGERQTWVEPAVHWTRWLLAALLLAFCSVQALLVLHNENLHRAVRDHGRLLRSYWLQVAWFVLVALLHFFALAAANGLLLQTLGQWTWPSAAWSLILYPILWTSLAAWLLASWVCLFKRCESGRAETDELVAY